MASVTAPLDGEPPCVSRANPPLLFVVWFCDGEEEEARQLRFIESCSSVPSTDSRGRSVVHTRARDVKRQRRRDFGEVGYISRGTVRSTRNNFKRVQPIRSPYKFFARPSLPLHLLIFLPTHWGRLPAPNARQCKPAEAAAAAADTLCYTTQCMTANESVCFYSLFFHDYSPSRLSSR